MCVRAERDQNDILEDNEKAERRHQRTRVLGGIAILHFEITVSESLDHQRSHHGDRDADQKAV